MSLKRSNYRCICGGEVTKLSQNGAVSRSCNNCDTPTSSFGIRGFIIKSYDEFMKVELIRDYDEKIVYSNSFLKKDIQEGNLVNMLNNNLNIKLEICESDEYTKVKYKENIYKIYLNGLPLERKDRILLIDDKVSQSHEYKNSIFDRD